MSYHKEARPNELWVGNTRRDGDIIDRLRVIGIHSARLGDTAYCINGKPLPNDYAPLIISRAESATYNDYMMRRTFGSNWRQG